MNNEQLAKQAAEKINSELHTLLVIDQPETDIFCTIRDTYAPHINDLLTTIREMRDVIENAMKVIAPTYDEKAKSIQSGIGPKFHLENALKAITLADTHLEPTDET